MKVGLGQSVFGGGMVIVWVLDGYRLVCWKDRWKDVSDLGGGKDEV